MKTKDYLNSGNFGIRCINTNEIPSERSLGSMISSHVKITREKITVAMVTCENRAFRCLS